MARAKLTSVRFRTGSQVLNIDVSHAIVSKADVLGGRFGRLQERARAATYLCSPFAAYVTGAIFVVNGAN